MNISLYYSTGSNCSARVEWALNYKAIKFEKIEVSDEFFLEGYSNINPFGYVPAIDIEGQIFSESMAIIECLEELFPQPSLYPTLPLERLCVREICEYVNSTIHPALNKVIIQHINNGLDEKRTQTLRADWISQKLVTLSKQLWHKSKFAVGEKFTLADIFVAIIYQKALLLGAEKLPDYHRYLSFLKVQNSVKYCELSNT